MSKHIGRPTVWSPELEATLIKHIEHGASFKDACELVSVGFSTFYEHRADYPEFSERVQAAAVKQKQAHVQNVGRCAFGVPMRNDKNEPIPGQWDVEPDGKLSLAYLQARYPEEYSRYRLEVTGKDGGPIKVAHAIEVMPIAAVESEIAALLPGSLDDEITDTPVLPGLPPSTTN
jgi:hypothetical protein